MLAAAAIVFGIIEYLFGQLPVPAFDKDDHLRIALTLGGAMVWFVGAKLNSGYNHHTFFFIPIQWIGMVITILMPATYVIRMILSATGVLDIINAPAG